MATTVVGSALPAGTNYIGLATVNVGNTPAVTFTSGSTVAVSNLPNVTVNALPAGTAYIGLASVNIGGTLPALVAGTAYIGLASVNVGGTLPALTAGTAYIGLASVNIGGTLPVLTAGTNYIGLASVNVGGSLPAGTNYLGLASVNIGGKATAVGKTLNISPIAIAATNLSGATSFVAASTKKFYITNLILANASAVGINIISGATYLTGNASLRIQLAANSGFVEAGSVESPTYFGLAAQKDFSIVTDTAAPVVGKVIWFEET